MGSSNHYLFASLGHGNEQLIEQYGTHVFNSTQTSWLVDHTGTIVVKNIIKLEELSKNMALLSNDIPCLKETENEANQNEMIHVNKAPPYPDYRLFANNENTRRIIEEVFAADFRNLGYSLL